MIKYYLIIIASCLFLSNFSMASEPPGCRVDCVIFSYGAKLGAPKPSKIISAKNIARTVIKKVAEKIVYEWVSKSAGSLGNFAANFNTAQLVHHADIVYAYRFVHNNKPVGDWVLGSERQPNGEVDYWFAPKDSAVALRNRTEALQDEWEEQLEQQCKNHNEEQ